MGHICTLTDQTSTQWSGRIQESYWQLVMILARLNCSSTQHAFPNNFSTSIRAIPVHITGIKWSYNDEYMMSIGGLEKSIIQWKVDADQEVAYEYEEEKHLEPDEEPVQMEGEYEF